MDDSRDDSGNVYCISNPALPGLIYIGTTTGLVPAALEEMGFLQERELGFSPVLRLEWFEAVDDLWTVETDLQDALETHRDDERTSYYRCSPDEAHSALTDVLGRIGRAEPLGGVFGQIGEATHGRIFCLSNQVMPGLIYVGATARDMSATLKDINALKGDVAGQFYHAGEFALEWAEEVDQIWLICDELRNRLAGLLDPDESDYYRCSPEAAHSVLVEMLKIADQNDF